MLHQAGPEPCTVAIVDDADLPAAGKLAAAVERGGLWAALRILRPDRAPGDVRIVIAPELAGFAAGSPAITDPALVESLIDLLHAQGFSDVTVVGAPDSSTLWAGNRDVFALTDLLGYRFVTPDGNAYDIVDLSDAADCTGFPVDCALAGTGISRIWLDADVRIVFSKNRTDEQVGYALGLDTLIGVLPLVDKDLHYRMRRHSGDVLATLLAAAPVDFCLIDAIVSTHGVAGRRAPVAINTGTIIAAADIVVCDYIGALKMGLDPATSPTYQRVLRTHPLPRRYTVSGALAPYRDWQNVPVPALRAVQLRSQAEALDRLVVPWLQRLDAELFPLKQPLDARCNAALTDFFADTDPNAPSQWLLVLANTILGIIGQAMHAYRTLFDKDALRQRAVPLGIDLGATEDGAFDALVEELQALAPIAASAPAVTDELRWRSVDRAVVFEYARTLPIDYDLFVQRVDIARTIQFMNDYLGGVIIVLSRDTEGRAIRQAERNIYLPQPNYLVLYHGKPIDVSKLEVVEYRPNHHRLYWKTVYSENESASSDDGIATFERCPVGTRVSIMGRQQFALPLFWQVFDLDLIPDLKSHLVTHAYRTFFDRTIANFEALVEGRDIHIGRPIDQPSPPPLEQLMPVLQQIGEFALPLLQRFTAGQDVAAAQPAQHTDADGFVHVSPAQAAANTTAAEPWVGEIARFVQDLGQAIARDLGRA